MGQDRGCGSRSASGGHIGSCGQASLCPGSGAGGGHDRFPSRSRKADRRQHAPERRRARSEGEGPIPYGSRQTRIAAARRRASMFADYPRRGQASPLQLFTPTGATEHPHRATGRARSGLALVHSSETTGIVAMLLSELVTPDPLETCDRTVIIAPARVGQRPVAKFRRRTKPPGRR